MELTVGSRYSICDFCSSPIVWAIFPAKSFNWCKLGDTHVNSKDDWAACKVCTELIEANQWDKLVDRSLQKFKQGFPFTLTEREVKELRKMVVDLHAKFRANRTQTH